MAKSLLKIATCSVLATASILAIAGQRARGQATPTATASTPAAQGPGSDPASVRARELVRQKTAGPDGNGGMVLAHWVPAEDLAMEAGSGNREKACRMDGKQAGVTEESKRKKGFFSSGGYPGGFYNSGFGWGTSAAGNAAKKNAKEIEDCVGAPQIPLQTQASTQAPAQTSPAQLTASTPTQTSPIQNPNPVITDPETPKPLTGTESIITKPASTNAVVDWPITYNSPHTFRASALNLAMRSERPVGIDPVDYKYLSILITTTKGVVTVPVAPDLSSEHYTVQVEQPDGSKRPQARFYYYLANTGGLHDLEGTVGTTIGGQPIKIHHGEVQIFIDKESHQIAGLRNLSTYKTQERFVFCPPESLIKQVQVSQPAKTASNAAP